MKNLMKALTAAIFLTVSIGVIAETVPWCCVEAWCCDGYKAICCD